MTNTQEGNPAGRKVYTAKVQMKAQSSTGCAFCWFVLAVYPTLQGMTEKDADTYRAHLERSHGLSYDIHA